MIKVKIEQLASDVATLLGESLAPECCPEESPFPDLEARVRIMVPEVLTRLISEAKPEELWDCKPLEGPVVIDSSGTGRLTLPEDFLRLVYIKMSDWSHGVTEVTTFSDPLFRRQFSRWDGIRGTPQRPVAIMEFKGEGRRELVLLSSVAEASLEIGIYAPVPTVAADDTIEIPSALYQKVTPSLTSQIMR